jgi:hypothetical protein
MFESLFNGCGSPCISQIQPKCLELFRKFLREDVAIVGGVKPEFYAIQRLVSINDTSGGAGRASHLTQRRQSRKGASSDACSWKNPIIPPKSVSVALRRDRAEAKGEGRGRSNSRKSLTDRNLFFAAWPVIDAARVRKNWFCVSLIPLA